MLYDQTAWSRDETACAIRPDRDVSLVQANVLVNAAGPNNLRGAVRIAIPIAITGVVPLVMLASLWPPPPHLHPTAILLSIPGLELSRVWIQASALAALHWNRR